MSEVDVSPFVFEHVSSSPKSSPKTSPRGPANKVVMNSTEEQEGGGGDSCGPPPHKMRSPRSQGTENNSADTKSSAVSGDSGGTVSTAMISPKHKDPDRIKKDREREERVRQARERLEEERKKKLVELQEQQRQAQENREKQLEMRRKKIEDLRRREVERRAEVEKRRRERETAERSRRETMLLKAEERVARYEAWKRSGQKGGRGHVLGFGSATPRDICQPLERPRRSSSHSALVRHSPNGSDSDYSFRPQRRALSACSTVRRHCCVDLNRTGPPPGSSMPTATKHLSVSTSVLYHKRSSDFSSSGALNVSNRPESLLALNTIPEGRRSVLAPSAPPSSRPKSTMNLSTSSMGSTSGTGVRLRENKSPRKPRPASVGASMPSFVNVDGSKGSTPRSKSTDRLARDRSRPRGAVSASRADNREEEKTTPDKPGVKMSRKTLERLSTPRQVPTGDGDRKDSSSTPRRETNLTRKSSLREKTTKETPAKTPQTPKDTSVKPSQQTPKDTPVKVQQQTPKEKPAKPQQQTTPAAPSPVTVPPVASSTPRSTSPRSASPASHTPSRTPVRVLSPTPGADEDGGSNTPQARSTPTPMDKSTGDISAEEYKLKLAEKRRQAREKAEKEAEEERKRQEEQQRLEEERRLQEEEEQRLRDEEALKLAEEARKAEEERLQKAIEAEEARRAEEAARLEQERLAKEEAERKAKEEAERLEQERQEKARREEEERLERKKRLEMIMKRVKTDNTGEGVKDSPKSVSSSPTKSAASTASSDNSPLEPDSKTILTTSALSEDRKKSMDSNAEESRSPANGTMSPANAPSPVPFAAQESTSVKSSSSQENMLEAKEESTPTSSRSASPIVSAILTPRGETSSLESGADKPKFKSPLLQKLVEGKDDAGSSPGGAPRFKSPLLQNLLGKTRVGARMGLTQDYSRSSPDLSQMDHSTNERASNASPTVMAMSSSMIDMDTVDSGSKEEMNRNEEKDVDTSEESSSSSHSSPSHRSRKTVVSNGEEGSSTVSVSASSPQNNAPTPMEISMTMESSAAPGIMTTSSAALWNEQDSGVVVGSEDLRSSAASSSLQASLNGHTASVTSQGQELEDSSISMQSLDSVTSPLTDSAAGNVPSTQSPAHEHSSDDKNFEELIDLSINNTTTTTTTSSGVALLGNSDDLVNFNKLEEGSEAPALPPPIIAFEESNIKRHQDVPDLLS